MPSLVWFPSDLGRLSCCMVREGCQHSVCKFLMQPGQPRSSRLHPMRNWRWRGRWAQLTLSTTAPSQIGRWKQRESRMGAAWIISVGLNPCWESCYPCWISVLSEISGASASRSTPLLSLLRSIFILGEKRRRENLKAGAVSLARIHSYSRLRFLTLFSNTRTWNKYTLTLL